MALPPGRIRFIIDKLKDIPTLPSVVVTLMELLTKPGVSVEQVARIINRDLALSAKVLRMVNSAYYGLRSKVTSISQACVLLGFKTIYSIVVTTSVIDMFSTKGKTDNFSREKFWLHSIGCATAAKLISKNLGVYDPDQAWIAGLLHDIGRVIIDQFLPEEFSQILELTLERGMPLMDAEKQILGSTHSEIGVWLLEKWRLESQYIDVVGYHHFPRMARVSKPLVSLIHLSDFICHRSNIGSSGDDKLPAFDDSVFIDMRLDAEKLKTIVHSVELEVISSKEILKLMG